MHGRMNTP